MVQMDRILFNTLLAYSVTLLSMYLLFSILSPFLALIVWAGAIGIITYPLYEKVLAHCHGREIVSAALMTTAVVLALVIPLLGLVFTLSREATLAYQYLERASSGTAGITLDGIMNHPLVAIVRDRVEPLTGHLNLDLNEMVLPAIKKSISSILNYSTGIVKNFLGFLFKLSLMLITLFFIYKDGPRSLQVFWQVVPIGGKLRDTIVETVTRVLGAVMFGVIMTCMVQGALGGLGFWVAGLPSPFLFGTLMALFAPIPFVGTALIWLPGAAYLLMQGQTLPGILLIVWGALAVGSIDNILRPLFISGRAHLPILVIVFGVLGGFLAFGLSGVVAGPVILALVLVFFDTYRAETVDADNGAQ
jgi:predicted PurR-regulated permease PerM